MQGGLEGPLPFRAGVCQVLDNPKLSGKRIRLSGWIRTDSLMAEAYIKVYCTTIEGDVSEPAPAQFAGTREWTQTSTDIDVRKPAIEKLREVGSDKAVPRLIEIARTDEDCGPRAVAALVRGREKAPPELLSLLKEKPEDYLRLVEAQGLKIQLRSPMKPVVKLAFAGLTDDSTIGQLEAVLAWALKSDLPRGSLAERIIAEGGIGQILGGKPN